MTGMLVTIGIKCFNQKATIGGAIEAALMQTYRPLEVVVSDDGSTDGSWDVIEAFAGSKKSGLTVVVRRSETNEGNMGNWLRICEAAKGDWIVKADGDDLSEPTRVEKLVSAIKAAQEQVFVASSGGIKIDDAGREVGRFKARSAWYPLGAVMAFHRRTFTDFPRPTDLRNVDDEIFARRGLILGDGREVVVEEPLVRYRIGTGISSSVENVRETELKCMRMNCMSFAQVRVDLKYLGERSGRLEWVKILCEQERLVGLGIELRSAPTFLRRLRAWWKLPGKSLLTPYGVKLLLYLLPLKAGDVCLRRLTKLRYR